MTNSLYEQLQTAKNIPEEFRQARESYEQLIEQYTLLQPLPGIRHFNDNRNLEPVKGHFATNTPFGLFVVNYIEFEKETILKFRQNPFITNALEGRQTTSEAYRELAAFHSGIRKYLPRRKDAEHNKKVEQIGELAGIYPIWLYKKGVLSPDNVVNGVIYGGALCLVVSYLVVDILLSGGNPNPNVERIIQLESVMGALMGGSLLHRYKRSYEKPPLKERLAYIDDTIKRLF